MKTQIAKVLFSMSAVIGLALTQAGAHGDAAAQNPADALLAQAAQTLSSAKSLQADFEEDDTYPTPYKDLAQRGTVTLEKPGEARLDIKRFRRVTSTDDWAASGNDAVSVSDGTTYTYAFLHPHSTQVRAEPATPRALKSALRSLPSLAGFFADADQAAFEHPDGPAVLLPPAVWEGSVYQVVEYPVDTAEQTYDARAYIGADHIVHRLLYQAQTAQGEVVKEWTLHNVRLNADIPVAAFAYTAPADATPLDTSLRQTLLSPGTDAPDFTVTNAQGRPVKLSDFRGKTVLLDFWATWCWPCNQSLPHTEAVVHANSDKNVVALAVAIWDSRAGFDAWIKKHNYPDIRFAIDPRPQGQDVASALYHVTATPTAYVIGPDGKVVTALSGYAGPTSELQAAIESASSVKTSKL